MSDKELVISIVAISVLTFGGVIISAIAIIARAIKICEKYTVETEEEEEL